MTSKHRTATCSSHTGRSQTTQEEGRQCGIPPLDTLKSLFALIVKEGLNLMVTDVKEAYLNSIVKPEVGNRYAQASEERTNSGMCWKLERWLCAMRPAARA